MYAGIIFDLDGTLVDSLEDIGRAMDAALARFGLPGHPLADYRHMVGEGAASLAEKASKGSGIELAALLDAYRDEYAARAHVSSTVYPGVAEVVARLAARGVTLAVLSNKPDDFTRELVTVRFPDSPFRLVRGQRPGAPRKPDPAVALELAAALGLAPAEMAFVGDTAVDVLTGRAAGMTAIGVLWGFRGRDELEAAGARYVIGEPAELLRVADAHG